MSQKNLKKAEKKILSRLELNSRTPFSKFKKRLRKSQQQISYTVNSLLKKGIIQQFNTIIDYSKLNVLSFRVYFKVSYVGKEKFTKLIEFLKSDPHTSWVATCGGRYDLICTFMSANPSQFNKTLKAIMAKFPAQLKNYLVLTTVVVRGFGRKHFFKNFSILPEIIYGGDRKPEEIDETDMKILSQLSEKARMSSVRLGRMLSLTPKTIIQRIKKLQERKIIVGFKPILNPRKMGLNSTLLMIRYHNVSSEMEDKLIDYLKAHPNVVSAVKTLGEWDIEIQIEVGETAALRKIEMEIRQKFALLIQEIESIPLFTTYKENFFPKFLLF